MSRYLSKIGGLTNRLYFEMSDREKAYTSLCTVFCVLIVLGNLTYQKFVTLLSLPFHTFQLSVGAILYPLTFFITDLIAEFYGKQKAQFCVRFAIFMNIMVALIIVCMDNLPATGWSRVDDFTFHQVFGFYSVAFFASVIACYIAQVVDITLYLWIRNLTKGRYLWLRNVGSTSLSLFIDTFVVIGVMSLFGLFPNDQVWPLIANSYLWKLLVTLCSVPLFYLGFRRLNQTRPITGVS